MSEIKLAKMRVVFWGTYDTGKPRVRILLAGLKANNIDLYECHSPVWDGVEDKTELTGITGRVLIILKWLFVYPSLIWRYLRIPRHDVVVIGYFGHLDVLVLWPFAKIRGVPIVWDTFISLHNTVVEDRKLVGPRNPLAFICYVWEWSALRLSTLALMDTAAHANFLAKKYGLAGNRVSYIYVGSEPEAFKRQSLEKNTTPPIPEFTVLFYGQYIPLHGIGTIIKAAKLCENTDIHFRLIGRGQEYGKMRELAAQLNCKNIDWIDWVPYAGLPQKIHQADICLGIFGTSLKAQLVIPNKVYQVIACGRPLITANTPAANELLNDYPFARLVPPGDPEAIVQAINKLRVAKFSKQDHAKASRLSENISPKAIGKSLVCILQKVVSSNS